MNYSLSFPDPQQHFIHLEISLPANKSKTELCLPTWRPGRYEIGPYAENICDVNASTESGQALKVRKTSTHVWRIEPSSEPIVFRYKYHAIAGDAGGSYFDEKQVYINGINLFMYQKDRIHEACTVNLDLPKNYQIACGLTVQNHVLQAQDFHQLVDAPFIASDSLQHHAFDVGGTTHNLWFQGNVRPDWKKLEDHFTKFGLAQVALFGDFPVDEYHYLFQIHNQKFYHGVEHFNSTVISLGPGYKLMQPELYVELLGVSCHELFHTWNVKAIRPADMQPYNYDGPNYSRLHYVTEGVTTYYGDLMLLKGGVWNLEEYLHVFNNSILKRHYANQGRNHISLEQASFDSWLTGYKAGAPNHKISFYTKGCLAAFILDYIIRSSTDNLRSLDTAMKEMYERYGKTGKGYKRSDYREVMEKHAGRSLGRYFKKVIAGTLPLENILKDAGHYFGLGFSARKFKHDYERDFGFQVTAGSSFAKVKQIFENSPATKAGLSVGDLLVAVEGIRVMPKDTGELFLHFANKKTLKLHVFRNGDLTEIKLKRNSDYQEELYMFSPMPNPNLDQIRNLKAWINVAPA